MPTQKVFKQRVRARMAKTGEAYTAARARLLHKADGELPDASAPPDPALYPTADDALVRATGRGYVDWFTDLDAWGASAQTHTRIAAWLVGEREVDGWWAQTITVGYERARGMRATHQVGGTYQVGVTRTVGVDAATLLAAFTESATREQWLPGAKVARRRSTAAGVARFDWADPASRLVVSVAAKGDAKATVSLVHERLPDPDAADAFKRFWRERLDALRTLLGG